MSTVITAEARIIGRDLTGDAFASVAKKINGLGKSAKVAAEVDRLSKSVERAGKHLRAIDDFKTSQSGFTTARARFRETQAAVEATGRALATTTTRTREMEAAHRQAQREVAAASRVYERKRDAVLGAKRAIESYGTPASRVIADEKRVRAAIDQSSAAIERQVRLVERRAARRDALGVVGAGAGVLAAHKGKEIGAKAIVSAAEFDIGVRKQRAFTDLSAAEQGPLIAQAKKIGQETPFSNLDVVKAQTKAMQGLPAGFSSQLKAEVAQGILENVRNYALVMESDLEKSSEAIRSYLQSTGKDISTKEKALKAANVATNQLVKMAKLGGMSDEDVQQYMKFAGASGTAGGLSSETMMAIGAMARRGGLRGDEAGVFVRAMSSKLNSPTRDGLAALNAAGVDYSKYVRMPETLSVDRLEGQFKNDLGKGFTLAVRGRLEKVLGDKSLLGDRGAFTTAVTEAVSELFGKTKKGTMAAADRQKIARSAGKFHSVSGASVDAEGLIDAVFRSGMTLPQLNKFLTDKHGGKGAITQQQWDQFGSDREAIRRTADEPDFAKKKAEEIMGGLGGSLENLKGSIDNAILAIGNALEGPLKATFDKLGAGLDAFANLPPAVVGTTAAVVGLGVAATGVASTLKLAGLIFGAGGGIAAGTAGGAVGGAAAGATGGAAAAGAAAGTASGGVLAGARAAMAFSPQVALGTLILAGAAAMKHAATNDEPRGTTGPGSRKAGLAYRKNLDDAWGPAVPGPAAGGGGPVEAKLTGSAEVSGKVETTVKVEPGSALIAIPEQVKALQAQVKGALNAAGSAGAKGTSMPHVASPPTP